MNRKILITGSAGHLGEALMRSLPAQGDQVTGIDIKQSEFTQHCGSIVDRDFVKHCMNGIDAVLHTATLHKPHVGTHSRQSFVDTNITGTLNLLEEAALAGVKSFIYTSTTSTFGDAMQSKPGEPAVWVTENLQSIHKNIYGVTKSAAEGMCEFFARKRGLPCLVLRTSRFFAEEDDNRRHRDAYEDDNLKLNELLFRRADIQDIVDVHRLAIDNAPEIVFDRFIISATPPFGINDLARLGVDAPAVVQAYFPDYVDIFEKLNWRMFPTIGRVYVNANAVSRLGWIPQYTFEYALYCIKLGRNFRSPLAIAVGSKGYHERVFKEGPYPVEP